MSIIYDALKKVEKTADKSSPVKEPKIRNTRKPKPILIYILVILIGLYAGNIIMGKMTKPKPKNAPVIPPSLTSVRQHDVAPTPQPAPVEKPAPKHELLRTREPSLTLSGVFFENDKGSALINNQILKVDDTILGAKVEEIHLDKVILDFEGRKITLINARK